MTYQTNSELQAIIDYHNLFPNKKLGQNFLINEKITQKITSSCQITPNETIIEIGPGLGILTTSLLKTKNKVIAIEKDHRLVQYLNSTLNQYNNLHLLHQDALKFIPEINNYQIIANIPYYITSPLILHFLTLTKFKPKRITLLVQKEYAEKIKKSSKNETSLSITIKNFADFKYLFTVSANNFNPKPKVDSALIQLTPFNEPILSNYKFFQKISSTAFQQKRKTLLNSLYQSTKIPKLELIKIIESINLPPTIRPEKLTIHDWEKLTNFLSSKK